MSLAYKGEAEGGKPFIPCLYCQRNNLGRIANNKCGRTGMTSSAFLFHTDTEQQDRPTERRGQHEGVGQ